jgi:hypothetical protein
MTRSRQPRGRDGRFGRGLAPAPPTVPPVPDRPSPPAVQQPLLEGAFARLARPGSRPSARLVEWERHAAVDRLVDAAWNATAVDQAYLAGSRHERVRAAVARSGNDPAVHDVLAGDRVASVREQLAANPRVSAGVLDRLARSSSSTCVSRVIAHPSTAQATLERLAAHPLPGVHGPARSRLEARTAPGLL